jgi:hypothetical protein
MMATRVDVNQNLAANDGSPRLDDPQNTGNGRFENGTIISGNGLNIAIQPRLLGNGGDYVEAQTGLAFDIPFAIVRSGTVLMQGQVVALAGTTFSVRVTTGGANLNQARAGDSFRLLGVPSMVIQSVSTQNTPNTVTVQQLAAIPFVLLDDDVTSHPFNVDTSLMQHSDNQNQNLFAPAYIRPEYDVLGTGPTQPSFNLHMESGVNLQEVLNQLNSGRDYASTDQYWVAYIQGAFQGPVDHANGADADPDQGRVVLGDTPTYVNNPPSNRQQGSLVYVEAIRDSRAVLDRFGQCPNVNLLSTTTVHEVGHQFGLGDNTGGIMDQGCVPITNQRFLPNHIADMRRRSHP